MSKKSIMIESRDIIYRHLQKQDYPRLSELISSSPEAMPLIFHHLDSKTRYRILMLRFGYEKYIDRLKRFIMSLSLSDLLKRTYDRTGIVAVDKTSGKVIGAVFLSSLVDSWSIDIIVVDVVYRGKGIGTMLVELAKEYAKRLGARSIITSTISNSQQARFFKDRGFVVMHTLNEMEFIL